MAQLCISFQQVKAGSPDYADRDVEEAMEDFIQRIECYKSSYMPIDDERDRYHKHRSVNIQDIPLMTLFLILS